MAAGPTVYVHRFGSIWPQGSPHEFQALKTRYRILGIPIILFGAWMLVGLVKMSLTRRIPIFLSVNSNVVPTNDRALTNGIAARQIVHDLTIHAILV